MLPEAVISQVPIPHSAPPSGVVHFSPNIRTSQGINWPHAFSSAAAAGVIAAALMMFPFGVSGLGMIASGALAAIIYYRRTQGSNVNFGTGAILGAMSGIIGFGIFTVFATVVILFTGTQGLRKAMLDALNQYSAQINDPQKLQILEYFKTAEGLALVLVFGLFFMFLIFLIFSTAGGALGTVWVRRRKRR
jgi:hypothetical protein